MQPTPGLNARIGDHGGPIPLVRRVAEAAMPSRFGEFRIVGFRGPDGEDLAAVVKGEVDGQEGVPVRLHSQCFTGDIMGSLRCDCRDQLEAALSFIGRAERGAVIYLPQEGRGIGLVNKIRAYALQDAGLDTVEANLALGFPDDLRRYDVAAQMVRGLGIRSVCLMTNNPNKMAGLQRHGIPVVGRLPHKMAANEHNAYYLETKKRRSGHLL
ncbi:MAG: GTP cyclohydrolase II [Alphaproteobacteria bacterium]|nr:GTP cyclohydrolase II [Alphaproteobacteria bacterium]MCB9797832.1 GTP cyclohydrolase II [Alphaproteobacteria bacterium]